MFQFFELPITFLSFFMIIAAYGLLNKEKEKRDHTFFYITILFFISTFTLLPYIQYRDALDKIQIFNNGKSLECISNQNNFGSTEKFLVNNQNWKVKEYEFVREDGLMVMAHKCEE